MRKSKPYKSKLYKDIVLEPYEDGEDALPKSAGESFAVPEEKAIRTVEQQPEEKAAHALKHQSEESAVRTVEKPVKERQVQAVEPSERARRRSAKKQKELTKLKKFSVVWTVLSTLYTVVMTCVFIGRDWVSNTVSYVLVAILALYVAVFIVLVVLTIKYPRSGAKGVKIYKKLLKIFKASASITMLVITAISLAGMTQVGLAGVMKWVVFVLSFIVALIQLALNITMLIMKSVQMAVARKFHVEVEKFVDGKLVKKGILDKMQEKKYRD